MAKIQVKVADVCTLTLRPDRRWDVEMHDPEDPREDYYKGEADMISADNRPSPADGEPGYMLAKLVAERFGGKAILPPLQPREKGLVY